MHIIPNFLEEKVLNDILQKYENSLGQNVFEINEMTRWPSDLYAGNFGPVYVLRFDEYKEYFTEKFSYISTFKDYQIATCFMHIWQKGSGIRWHQDSIQSNQRIGATVYLNKDWNSNWGGLFLYENNGQTGWYNPQYNQCVWFESPMWHSVSILSNDIPQPRISIQMFFDRK